MGMVKLPEPTVFATELPEIMPCSAEAITATLAGPPTAAPAIELAMSRKYLPTPVLSRKEPKRINSTMKVEQTPMGVPMTPSVV